MLHLQPGKICITRDVYEDADARARVERMLGAIECPDVEVVDDARLSQIVEERGWRHVKRWGEIAEPQDPDLVFTTAKFDSPEEAARRRERYPNLSVRDLYGYHTFWFRPDGTAEFRERTKGIVCQSAWQLHTINGCPFRCHYCSFGGVNRVLANIGEYCRHLDEWTAVAPQQRLYKWDNQTDVNCFEPEYGASKALVEWFAGREGKYLEIYAGKSDNVDHLLGLDHRGHTIIQWSIGGRTQCDLFEPRTASMEERIEAVRKCQQAGYICRYRFSPIIPVENWREEYRELIDLIYQRTHPDVISLCAFGWMDLDDARRCLDFSILDEEMVAAMEAAAPFVRERGYTAGGGRPLPHEARYVVFRFIIEEIRKHTDKTAVALCLETEEMWQALGRLIGQSASDYVCNCGPMCTPGAPLYDRLVGTPLGPP
ncbi:MAG: spore photoproduct lyase family protein [Armatimonadota bacterium]